MKFIHLADVHLGAAACENEEENERRQRQAWDTFVSTVEDAGKENVDLMLIAGDLFDVPPSPEDLAEINTLFSRIPNVRIVIIAGDHDYVEHGSAWLSMRWNKNVAVLLSRNCECVRFPEIGTDVYGMSYYSQTLPERVCDDLEPLDKHKTNILLVHGGDADHIPMDPKTLAKTGFDYIALGHIHKPSAPIPRMAIYPGSLEPLSPVETGKHGYIMGETKGRRIKLEFIPKAKIRYSKQEKQVHDVNAPSPETSQEDQTRAQAAQGYEQEEPAEAVQVTTEAIRKTDPTESRLRILEMNPLGFGRFSGQQMKLRKGVNVIYGGNETGKTTLHAFIKDMLYGINSRSGKKGRDEYALREPMDGDGTYGGTLTVSLDGETYLIERSFLRNHRSVTMTQVSSGRTVNLDGREPGELLTGMTESEFMCSVCMQQGVLPSFEQTAEWIASYLDPAQEQEEPDEETEDEEETGTVPNLRLDPEQRIRVLLKEREKAEKQVEMAEFAVRTAYAARKERVGQKLTSLIGTGKMTDYFLFAWCVLCGLIGVISAFSVVFSGSIGMRFLYMMMTLVFGGAAVILLKYVRAGSGISERIADTDEETQTDSAGQRYVDEYREKVEAIDREIRRVREGDEYRLFEEKKAFNEALSIALSALTQGRCTKAVRDGNGEIQVLADGVLVYPQMLGTGSASQISLALRMTAASYMTGRMLPLLLDEPFVFYDNDRLTQTLRYLEHSGRQVILFTGQTREKQILDRIRAER